MSALLDRLYNMHWVTPELARSAQPYLGFQGHFLQSHGIRSVINLRGPNPLHRWYPLERSLSKSMGISHFDVRLSSRLVPTRANLVELIEAFETAPRPMLVKCSGGQDRTSLASALFLLFSEGPGALEKGQAQFAFWPFLHRPKKGQKWLKHFPVFAVEGMGARSLAAWMRETYDPTVFAQWLKARGEIGAYKALQAPD